jgi:hypothetical protein
MYPVVFCEATLGTETFTTEITGKWILIMFEHMSFQSLPVMERHITHITVIQLLLSMNDFMLLQIMLNNKYFVTNITCKWTHFTMHTPKMILRIKLPKKRFFMNITAIWRILYLLIFLHAQMFLQVTLITVGQSADIGHILNLSALNVNPQN